MKKPPALSSLKIIRRYPNPILLIQEGSQNPSKCRWQGQARCDFIGGDGKIGSLSILAMSKLLINPNWCLVLVDSLQPKLRNSLHIDNCILMACARTPTIQIYILKWLTFNFYAKNFRFYFFFQSFCECTLYTPTKCIRRELRKLQMTKFISFFIFFFKSCSFQLFFPCFLRIMYE